MRTITLTTDDEVYAWWITYTDDQACVRDGDGTLWLLSWVEDGDLYALRWATEGDLPGGGSSVVIPMDRLPLPITVYDIGSGDHDD